MAAAIFYAIRGVVTRMAIRKLKKYKCHFRGVPVSGMEPVILLKFALLVALDVIRQIQVAHPLRILV